MKSEECNKRLKTSELQIANNNTMFSSRWGNGPPRRFRAITDVKIQGVKRRIFNISVGKRNKTLHTPKAPFNAAVGYGGLEGRVKKYSLVYHFPATLGGGDDIDAFFG